MNRWLLAGVLATAGAVMVTLLVVIVAVLTLGVESRAFIASRDTPVSETDKVPIAPVVVRSWSSSKKTPDRAAKAGVAADMRSPTVLARAEARPVAAPTPTSSPIANADNGNGSVKPRPAESKPAPIGGGPKDLDLADLVEKVEPSVVQLNVSGPTGAFTGSGFVIDKQGTIATNYHVIQDATEGTAVFSDKTSVPIAGYLSVWPEKDIALLHVECPPDKLHPLDLATSPPRQGERVAAFGSPLGLSRSVSEGIVSAIRQSKELRTVVPVEVDALLIQTTTPISHGNSGGPLVNMKGMVVGVNTLTFQALGGENLNFAVSSADVQPVLWGSSKKLLPLPVGGKDQSTAGEVRRILNRAWAHVTAKEFDKAITDYTEAIRLDPKNAQAYTGRGCAYQCKRDWDTAIADYSEAIRLNPKNAEMYCKRGWVYNCRGDHDTAIADCTEAIRLDPKMADGYEYRAWAYNDKNDYDTAIADCSEAIRLDPKDCWAYTVRGWAYEGKGDWHSAVANLTEAIRLTPSDGYFYSVRGHIYIEMGQRYLANKDFAKAKALGYKP